MRVGRRACALATLLLFGCELAPREPENAEPARSYFTPTARIPIRVEGRSDLRDPEGPRFDWPASGFSFAFRGQGFSLALRDTVFPDAIRDTDLLAVYVDSSPPITLALDEGERAYAVVHGLSDREHVVHVRKRTEAEVGTVTFLGATLDPGGRFLEAPKRAARRILAIGDSITAGYGIDGPNAHCHYGAGTENATRTYAFLAAQQLDADYQAIAWSGRGLYRNYDLSRPETVRVFYPRLLASEPDSRFDPRAFVPDAIVINVGTNDLSTADPDRGRFVSSYHALLGELRADFPLAYVVLVVGPMLADDYPLPGSMALTKQRAWVSEVVSGRRARGDSRISLLEVYSNGSVDGYGCDYHPSRTTHRKIAGALAAHLREQAGF